MANLRDSKGKEKHKKYLAAKAREPFQQYMEQAKPRTPLSNKVVPPSGGNIGGGVTPPQNIEKEDDDLDFVAQARNMRNM